MAGDVPRDEGQQRLAPNPTSARTVGEFAACLRQLKGWAGDPSFVELCRRTGVPRSTLADALSPRRTRLPRLDLVRIIVRACGGRPEDIARWESGWRQVQEQQEVAVPEPPRMALPRQLPRGLSTLVGRERILNHLHSLHRQHATSAKRAPLALLVGAAGVGKTALAVHFGHRVAHSYPDGHLFADLHGAAATPVLTAEKALSAFLEALGVPRGHQPAGVAARAGLFRSITYARRVLVVLDNARDADHVRPLLPSGPWCFTLVTSRDRLSGLVAREDGLRATVQPLDPPDAVRLIELILEDGRGAREPEAVYELARLCGYLPIALRIAAANLADRPDWPISTYVVQLATGNRLAQLSVAGDESTAVRAAFDPSYASLDTATRRLFRMLSTTPDRAFTAAEAASLCDAEAADTGPRLEALGAAHLIERTGSDRYTMHDLVRLYAEYVAAQGLADRAAPVAPSRRSVRAASTAHGRRRVAVRTPALIGVETGVRPSLDDGRSLAGIRTKASAS